MRTRTISAHFKLRDFLTKDQPNVWPKYLLLNPKLLDKLELTIQELEAMGHPVRHLPDHERLSDARVQPRRRQYAGAPT